MSLTHDGKKSKSFLYSRFKRSSEVPFIILFLIKKGIARNEKEARRLVLASVLIILLISLYLSISCSNGPVFINNVK
jgi:hypothetical protein